MIGAIIGDIIGSSREFNNTLDYNFELFPRGSEFTDDTVCTVAVADAILRGIPYRDSLINWCRAYPHPMGGYGASFSRWLASSDPQPYDSFGNGAAMRVSPVGWAYDDVDSVLLEASKTASCSHSHPEGIKGAQAVALAVSLIRRSGSPAKHTVRRLCEAFYGTDYEDRLPRPGVWNETCQGCVPLAMHIFTQSTSYVDAVRRAVSYGGDSDTLGAIVGAMAGACWPIPACPAYPGPETGPCWP